MNFTAFNLPLSLPYRPSKAVGKRKWLTSSVKACARLRDQSPKKIFATASLVLSYDIWMAGPTKEGEGRHMAVEGRTWSLPHRP